MKTISVAPKLFLAVAVVQDWLVLQMMGFCSRILLAKSKPPILSFFQPVRDETL